MFGKRWLMADQVSEAHNPVVTNIVVVHLDQIAQVAPASWSDSQGRHLSSEVLCIEYISGMYVYILGNIEKFFEMATS